MKNTTLCHESLSSFMKTKLVIFCATSSLYSMFNTYTFTHKYLQNLCAENDLYIIANHKSVHLEHNTVFTHTQMKCEVG